MVIFTLQFPVTMQHHQTVTIKQIAQELGVSISTVSRALQNNPRIGLRTRERVWELARKLQYSPNPAALVLKKKRTHTIGVILPFLGEEFFSTAVTAIEDVLTGYNVVISQSRDRLDREKSALNTFLSSRVDGVIASLSAETHHYLHFRELENFGIPVVFFDRVPRSVPAHKVRNSVTKAARELVQYLAGKGLERIALLNGPPQLEVSEERQEGYIQAMTGAGLPVLPQYLRSTDLSREDTHTKTKLLLALEPKPQAIVGFNDYVALQAMEVAKQLQIRPNEDVYFASFANLPLMDYIDNPPVASVEQFAYTMGEKAAELLLHLIHHPDETRYHEVLVETQLFVREK